MIKVFLPVEKGKNKSAVRGFWYSKESKKIYYDYLKIDKIVLFNHYLKAELFTQLEDLKQRYNQEAIAYIEDNQLKIYYSINKIDVLCKKIVFEIGFNRHNLKGILKRALKDYQGCTIYQHNEGYRIEVFYNE